MTIEVSDIHKSFDQHPALQGVNLDIRQGELTSLLGPSGCGKTTLLRIMAGLEIPDRGTISYDGIDQSRISPRKRGVGFVFQNYALFSHMTVFENVAFGLRVLPAKERPKNSEIRSRVLEMLDLVQLNDHSQKKPSQLSGGQSQRVALARALATRPGILLMDEPFGALDAAVRKELRRWLRSLHHSMNITSVLVTHDQEEALEISDRVVVMNQGRVEQVGAPKEIYRTPANPFVYQFLGSANIISSPQNSKEDLFVRPHDIEVSRQSQGESDIRATLRRIAFVGAEVRLELVSEDDGRSYEADISADRHEALELTEGDTVFLSPRKTLSFMGQGI